MPTLICRFSATPVNVSAYRFKKISYCFGCSNVPAAVSSIKTTLRMICACQERACNTPPQEHGI